MIYTLYVLFPYTLLTCALYRQSRVRKCQRNFGLLSEARQGKCCPPNPEAPMGTLNSVVCLERQNHAGDCFGWWGMKDVGVMVYFFRSRPVVKKDTVSLPPVTLQTPV